MCGIAGYIGSAELDPGRIAAALRSMRHRGPDNAAHRAFRTRAGLQVYLLCTRLDIIDPDPRSDQPLRVGQKWIAFNGELYNYVEIRQSLIDRGRTFETGSDTEVLLAALDELGADALDLCEGMWAFAMYDERAGSLVLARDRFGEKPLYIHRDATGTYFASEPKSIFALLGRRLRPDLEHVYRYLVNGYKALYKRPRTFFADLSMVPRATLIEISADGQKRSRTYWSPDLAAEPLMTWEEAVAGARERVIRAVRLRLRSDVPLAFAMSGGVDSNSLIAVAKRVCSYDVHGFTILNRDERYDERELVAHAVDELAIRHTSIPVDTTGFLHHLRSLVRQHDAPVLTITYYAHALLMRSVAGHGYRVALSGSGADELFSGYYDHHLMYLRAVAGDPALFEHSLRAWERDVLPLVRNPLLRDPCRFIDDPTARDHIFFRADEFSAYLLRPWSEAFNEERYGLDLLRERMLNELFHEVVPVILHEDDLNAMACSIENRSPFLDRELFEFCVKIPTRYLIRDGRAKAVLREAMRGIVPPRVLDERRKVGFNAPIGSFLDTQDPAVKGELLAESPIYEHVHRDKIAALLDRSDLPNSESKFLFSFISAKMFVEEFGG